MFQMTKWLREYEEGIPCFELMHNSWVPWLKSHGIKSEIRTKLIKEQDHGRDYMRHHFAVFREGKEALWVPGKDATKKVA